MGVPEVPLRTLKLWGQPKLAGSAMAFAPMAGCTLPLTYASTPEVSSAWSRRRFVRPGSVVTGREQSVQNGLYFFMMLGVGLIFALGASVALAVLLDLREKLGQR